MSKQIAILPVVRVSEICEIVQLRAGPLTMEAVGGRTRSR